MGIITTMNKPSVGILTSRHSESSPVYVSMKQKRVSNGNNNNDI